MPVVDRINGLPTIDGTSNTRRVQDTGSKETGSFNLPADDHEGVIYEPGTAPGSEAKTMAQIREEIAREEAAAAKANIRTRFDGPGVAVELSTDGYAAAQKPAEQSIGAIFKDAWRSIVNFFLSIWNGGAQDAGNGAADADSAAAGQSVEQDGAADSLDPDLMKSGEQDAETETGAQHNPAGSETGFVPFMSDVTGTETGPAKDEPRTDIFPQFTSAPERSGASWSNPGGAVRNDPGSNVRSNPGGVTAGRGRERTNSPEDMAAFLADYGGGHLAKNSDLLTQYDRRGRIVSVNPSERRRILQGEGRVRRY